uniref:Secreted protein n=1 Tax=Pristhesancus plagipennis TaxID=1955184 RepID=A0A2K8JMB1_PRIPG|nr:secreted hypothetical protein [Pristhesancus plagipennis]
MIIFFFFFFFFFFFADWLCSNKIPVPFSRLNLKYILQIRIFEGYNNVEFLILLENMISNSIESLSEVFTLLNNSIIN